MSYNITDKNGDYTKIVSVLIKKVLKYLYFPFYKCFFLKQIKLHHHSFYYFITNHWLVPPILLNPTPEWYLLSPDF